jgi:hypothetical protein
MAQYTVYIKYININGSNVSTSINLQANSESEAKRIAISRILGRVISATIGKNGR